MERAACAVHYSSHELNCVCVFLSLDFQQSEIWMQVLQFEDPQLIHLAQALPQTVLQARAKGTTDKYAGAYRRWKVWAEREHSGRGFPVSVALFAWYLQHVGETVKSWSAVSDAVNAVSWVQSLAGVEPVSRNPLIKAINEGFQRSLAQPRRRKEPVTPEILGQAREHLLVGVCGMDQYRQGQLVPIARTGNPTCPVAMVHKYVVMGGIDTSSDLSLFRAICSVRGKVVEAKRATELLQNQGDRSG